MNRTAIEREILTRMDEILPPGDNLSHPFSNYMPSVLENAYLSALKDFPISLLSLTNLITSTSSPASGSWSPALVAGNIYIASADGTGALNGYETGDLVTTLGKVDAYDTVNKIAYIPAPDDFIRIGVFKFTDWVNPAKKHIIEESPEYQLIENGIIQGGKVRPVVVLKHDKRTGDATIKKYLACYKVETKDVNPKLWYVKNHVSGGLESLPDHAIPGLVWKACSELMQIIGNLNGTKISEERYQSFLLSNYK